MIKVYGVHGSPYVRKVFIALDIKDVPYEIVMQMPFSLDAEYLKINPLGKVPTLVDGDLTLCDSKVICQYLYDAYPEPMLDYLESQIPAGGFIFGDFMMADLSIASPFINAAYAGSEVDVSRWPNLVGLVARVRAQPLVAAVLEKEKRALGLN